MYFDVYLYFNLKTNIMENLEKLLKRETNYMFADVFYINLTKKLMDFMSDNKHKDGFVYFIKNGAYGSKVKIGSAIDIDKRVSSYQTAFNEKIFVIGYIKSEDYIFLEREIHSFFSDKRLKGEWFELNEFDLFNLRESFDFIDVNDFYNNRVLIKNMPKKINENKFNGIVDFCKKLEFNKYYNTGDLFRKYKNEYPESNIINASWFGRELSKTLGILGIKKKDSTNGGIRKFILLD